jgi:hypothetical protein
VQPIEPELHARERTVCQGIAIAAPITSGCRSDVRGLGWPTTACEDAKPGPLAVAASSTSSAKVRGDSCALALRACAPARRGKGHGRRFAWSSADGP